MEDLSGMVVQGRFEMLLWDKKRRKFVSQKTVPKTCDKIRMSLGILRGHELPDSPWYMASRCPVHTSEIDGQRFVWIRCIDEYDWEHDDGGTKIFADEYGSKKIGYTID